MNRNQFIKLAGLSGLALTSIPNLAFKQNKVLLAYDELIGKGNPELFGEGYKLRIEANDAFLAMKHEALQSDISLKVVSSYRDFHHQQTIWERKYKRYKSQGLTSETSIKKIIEYSTIPGTSRHHWGTDLDIVDANIKHPSSVLNPANFEKDACFGHSKQWMDLNAHNFGFYLVYTNDMDRKGFKYEPWHYSYRPLSIQYLSEFRQLNIFEILRNENFLGSGSFTEEFTNHYINEHILDINPDLL